MPGCFLLSVPRRKQDLDSMTRKLTVHGVLPWPARKPAKASPYPEHRLPGTPDRRRNRTAKAPRLTRVSPNTGRRDVAVVQDRSYERNGRPAVHGLLRSGKRP